MEANPAARSVSPRMTNRIVTTDSDETPMVPVSRRCRGAEVQHAAAGARPASNGRPEP